MNGLRDKIKNWVRLLGLDTRLVAFTTAKNVEVALGISGGAVNNTSSRAVFARGGGYVPHTTSFKIPSYSRPNQNGPPTIPNPRPPIFSHDCPKVDNSLRPSSSTPPVLPPHNKGLRHLTCREIEERRRLGLCFKCGEQFSPHHRCP